MAQSSVFAVNQIRTVVRLPAFAQKRLCENSRISRVATMAKRISGGICQISSVAVDSRLAGSRNVPGAKKIRHRPCLGFCLDDFFQALEGDQ